MQSIARACGLAKERIATPVCGLVRNDMVINTLLRRFWFYLLSIATATSRATFIMVVKEFWRS